MAFIAPLIGASLAAGGLTFFATAAGQAVINLGLSFGLSYLAKQLQPDQNSNAVQGVSLNLRYETNEAREIAFGRVASAGSLKYHNVYGPNKNDFVQLVFVLADHECDGLEKVIVDGKEVTLYTEDDTGTTQGTTIFEYPDVMWIKYHSGHWDQEADPDLLAHNPEFVAAYMGRGVSYVRVTMKYDAEKFPNGLPQFRFVFRGAKLYDPRQDSTVAGGSGPHRWGQPDTYEWTNNAAVCLYNFERGIFVNGDLLGGMAVPEGSMPLANWMAASNVCDEEVELKIAGAEPRYVLGAIVQVDNDNGTVVRNMLAAMAGVQVDSGGVFTVFPGAARSTVLDIVDADLMLKESYEDAPKLSRSELVNAVFGTFQDENQLYESVALPPRISLVDREADGGAYLPTSYGLAYVNSGTQGQRILEIFRRKGRCQRRVKCTLRAGVGLLESGDWISWTSARYGFNDATFEVLQTLPNRDMTVSVELREISAEVFSWIPSIDELDPLNPSVVTAGASTFTQVQGFDLDSILVEGVGAAQRPALRATWTPIDDVTVVQLLIQYRKVGDTVAVEKTVLSPGDGSFTWLEGVQGDIQYEARARPITQPPRDVTFTGWVATSTSTDPQVVDVAAFAESVAPGSITPEMLSAQTAFELALVTARDDVIGSVSQRLNEIWQQAQQAAEDALRASMDGHANRFSITETRQVMDTMGARWGIQINQHGHVVGMVQLDGTNAGSTFAVVADSFVVAQPGANGGAPRQVFTIAEVDGEVKLVLVGDMIADGSITARHIGVQTLSAISANIGSVNAGRIFRNTPQGSVDFNLDQLSLVFTTAA